MLCLPTTTTQCRISVRFLQNRPHASSPRAWRLVDSSRCHHRTGTRTFVRTRRWLPSSPLYSSVASESRPAMQRWTPAALLCSSNRRPLDESSPLPPPHPLRSPPTTPFRPMSFLGAMLIPAKQQRWVPNSPSICCHPKLVCSNRFKELVTSSALFYPGSTGSGTR